MRDLLIESKNIGFRIKVPYYFAAIVLAALAVGCQSVDESKINVNARIGGADSKSKETEEYIWAAIKYSKSESAMNEYISKFPNGKNINEAKLR